MKSSELLCIENLNLTPYRLKHRSQQNRKKSIEKFFLRQKMQLQLRNSAVKKAMKGSL